MLWPDDRIRLVSSISNANKRVLMTQVRDEYEEELAKRDARIAELEAKIDELSADNDELRTQLAGYK